VPKTFAERPLRQRIIALAAAYAIALASLISSFSAASVAAQAVAQPGGILCHTDVSGQSAPSTDETNNGICADCCCVGCLTLMAALPPPPAKAIAVSRPSSRNIAPLVIIVLAGGPTAKSHQSRAPPLTA
jgi:hypothetical protein